MTNPLEIAASGDEKTLLRDLRVRSLWQPYFLTKVVLGYKDLVDHLHLADSELFINRWAAGHRMQFVEWPRGFFKTTMFTIGTGIWVVCPVTDADTEYAIEKLGIPEKEWLERAKLHDQDATQLLAFENFDNASRKVSIIRNHFENNSMFRALFPEIAYTGVEKPWNDEGIRIRRVGPRKYDAEGTFDAIGAGGALQSRHYKIVWCDDLVGMKARDSVKVMEDTIEWFQLLGGAFERLDEQIRFGISNQWSYNDLNAWVKKHEPDFVFHTRAAWTIGENGQEIPTFPERLGMEAIRAQQKKMKPKDFAAQYMNRAVLEGDQVVDLALFHRYKVDENGFIICSCGARLDPINMLRWMHYDPYNAKARSTSRPAIAIIGTTTDKHACLLDYYVARENYRTIFDKLASFNDRWSPTLFTYEDVGAQNMSEFYIREREKTQEFRDAGHRKFPRIKAIPTKNKAKEVRIDDHFLQRVQQGLKFAYREQHLYFEDQLTTFPHPVFDHDYDLLDCVAQGATVWRYPVDQDAEEARQRREEEILKHLGAPYSHMRTE